jgi:acyl carrier protein
VEKSASTFPDRAPTPTKSSTHAKHAKPADFAARIARPAAIELSRGVRYTTTRLQTVVGARRQRDTDCRCIGNEIKGLMMSTFDQVANIIAETCDIPRDTITPESHAIDDLGIDSLDFLDIAFAIDKAFGIKLPLEKWTQEVNDGKATTEQYFVLGNLCARIDELVAAKGA